MPDSASQESRSVVVDGVEVVGKGADFLNRYGSSVVILAVFLTMFVAGAWIVRSDFRSSDKERTEAHERNIKHLNDSSERSVKNLTDAFLKIHADHREDAKEEKISQREAQAKMWARMGEIRDAAKEQTEAVRDLLFEFKKIANKMP